MNEVRSDSNSGNDPVRTPWARRAEELADWAWAQVNRTDVWGGYQPLARREQFGKTTTRPAVSQRGRRQLTRELLVRHFQATGAEDIVGLHTTAPDNTSRWGAIEIDRHGDTPHPDVILAAACLWRAQLLADGFRPLLTDSNGKGGVHLRVLFAASVATPRLYAWLQRLTDDFADVGLTARPETFPKQATVAPPGENGQYGNWLRLVGRHHTEPHWTGVWGGKTWLTGEAAVAELLTYRGDAVDLLPELAEVHA